MHDLSETVATPQLDRGKFNKVVAIKALRLPKQHCHRYVKQLKSVVLAQPKIKAVQQDRDDPNRRLLLLREDITDLDSPELPTGLKASLEKDGVEVTAYDLKFDYSHMSLEMVLKEVLPKGWEIPSSFETVGHIAHLNLREEYLPYKRIIGQVLLDKNSAIRTVVNKVGSIENEYRVLPMEVIAGEDKLEAVVRQHNAQFKLHYAEVYWNSRLEQEHQRLVEQFQEGDVIADVMAGIGPFAIPAGLQGNQVYANDLNPKSCHYLRENIKINKVDASVQAFEMDGRAFIRRMGGGETVPTAGDGSRQNGAASPVDLPPAGVRYDHAIMNLPASAVEFLDAFKGAFARDTWQGARLPLVHVYTFARTAETDRDIRIRIERHLGGAVGDEQFSIRLVRDVAPNKRMMCVTFRVPESIAFCSEEDQQAFQAPAKRQKLNS